MSEQKTVFPFGLSIESPFTLTPVADLNAVRPSLSQYGMQYVSLASKFGVVVTVNEIDGLDAFADLGRVGVYTQSTLWAYDPLNEQWQAVAQRELANDGADVTSILGLWTASALYGVNAAGTMDRVRVAGSNSDALATNAAGVTLANAMNRAFNGATWDRVRSGSAATLAAQTSLGAALHTIPGNWSVTHAPAANTVATITRAAGGAGVRHVCNSICGSLTAAGAAATPALTLVLRDGAAGVGTILWSATHMAGLGFADEISLSGLNIVGSANTAMTLEWSAAPGAGNFASVALTGYDAS